MPPESKSTCASCVNTTANCQHILTQVIISLEDASKVYQKLLPFVKKSSARQLLGDDAYTVHDQLKGALERLYAIEHDPKDRQRILRELAGKIDGSGTSLGDLPLFRRVENVGTREKVKEDGLKNPQMGFPVLELDSRLSDFRIPFVDSAEKFKSPEVLLDDDVMAIADEDHESNESGEKRDMALLPVPSYITLDFPRLLKAIREWLEDFFTYKDDGTNIPVCMVEQLAQFEMDFGLERLPTTSCIWNRDYQWQREDAFTITLPWGPIQRDRCLCLDMPLSPCTNQGQPYKDHSCDPHCPKNMPKDLDSGVLYIWDELIHAWKRPPYTGNIDDGDSDSGSETEMTEQARKRLKKKKAEDARKAWDEIMNMIGLKSVKEHVQKLKAKVENSIRQNIDLKEERFGAVFMGNSGTGKTTVARIYARYLYLMGIIKQDEIIETTGTYLSDGGIERTKRYVDKIADGGVMFIDDAMTLDDYNNGTKILDFLFQEIDRKRGSAVFILAGHEKGMRKLLGHGTKSVSSLLPNVLTFDDFSEPEILDLLGSCIKKRFDGRMEAEGGHDGLYMRIAARRVSRSRGGSQFGNARAVENLVAQIWERQSARLSKLRMERKFRAAKEKLMETLSAKEGTSEEKIVKDTKEEKAEANSKSETDNSLEIEDTDQETKNEEQQNKIEITVDAKKNTNISKDDKSVRDQEIKETAKPLHEKPSQKENVVSRLLEIQPQNGLVLASEMKQEPVIAVVSETDAMKGIEPEDTKQEDTTQSDGIIEDETSPKEMMISANTTVDEQRRKGEGCIENSSELCTMTPAESDGEVSEGTPPDEKTSVKEEMSSDIDSDSGSDFDPDTENQPELDPEDLLFTKEDILGPDPSSAILNSEAWQELQKLVGLEKVKTSLLTLLELVKTNYRRELEEKPLHQFTLNRLFLGPAGTGKTVVAKLYAKILGEIGALSKGEVIFRNPSDLIGQYIGDSEANTKAALNAARGNVLVIDEAYMLYSGNTDGTGNESDSYRQGVIDTIVAELQGNPGDDLCVLLLGYKEPMLEMLNHSNPGLSRRFPIENAFSFENFSIGELEKILRSKLALHALEATEEAIKVAMDVLRKASTRLNFGNGGEVENLISTARSNYQLRMSNKPVEERSGTWDFQPEDFDPEYDRGRSAHANLRRLFADVIGCEAIVKQLGQYQNVCQAMKSRNIDPRQYIPTNFVFKGPPGKITGLCSCSVPK